MDECKPLPRPRRPWRRRCRRRRWRRRAVPGGWPGSRCRILHRILSCRSRPCPPHGRDHTAHAVASERSEYRNITHRHVVMHTNQVLSRVPMAACGEIAEYDKQARSYILQGGVVPQPRQVPAPPSTPAPCPPSSGAPAGCPAAPRCRGLHSSTFQRNVSTFCGICGWVRRQKRLGMS